MQQAAHPAGRPLRGPMPPVGRNLRGRMYTVCQNMIATRNTLQGKKQNAASRPSRQRLLEEVDVLAGETHLGWRASGNCHNLRLSPAQANSSSHAQNLVKCNLVGFCGTPQRECNWCHEITSTGCDTAAATTAAGTIDACAASSCMTASACMLAWRHSSRRFRYPVHWPMAVCERWQAGPLRLAARASSDGRKARRHVIRELLDRTAAVTNPRPTALGTKVQAYPGLCASTTVAGRLRPRGAGSNDCWIGVYNAAGAAISAKLAADSRSSSTM